MAATTTLVHSRTVASENAAPMVRRGEFHLPQFCHVCGQGPFRNYRRRRDHERRRHPATAPYGDGKGVPA